jgi:hypothetical protein
VTAARGRGHRRWRWGRLGFRSGKRGIVEMKWSNRPDIGGVNRTFK